MKFGSWTTKDERCEGKQRYGTMALLEVSSVKSAEERPKISQVRELRVNEYLAVNPKQETRVARTQARDSESGFLVVLCREVL